MHVRQRRIASVRGERTMIRKGLTERRSSCLLERRFQIAMTEVV